MTFDQIVAEVAARTRQTSSEATTRIGRAVNDRYRRATTSVGLATSRRAEATENTTADDPIVTFDPSVEKILSVFLATGAARRVLEEITFDEWRGRWVDGHATGIPDCYAIDRMGPALVKIRLYPTPDQIYALQADVLASAIVLGGAVEPQLPSDFHDILMHGALADEWMQLKQDDLSKRSEAMFEQRLSELRMFIAKSAYLNIHQGKRSAWPGWWPRWGWF